MIRISLLATAILASASSYAAKTDDSVVLDYDQEQLKIAESIPGFAGYILQDGGVAQVYMVEQRNIDARASLSRVFGDKVIIKPAQFTFQELYAQKQAATALLSRSDLSVVSVDLDESQNRVVVGVEATSSRSQLLSLENEFSIRGFARDAIVVENVELVNQNIGRSLKASLNPIPGGAEVGFGNGICTNGVNVVRAGVAGFITAAHCAYNSAGLSVAQPAGSGSIIGTLAAYGSATTTGCPAGQTCKYSDALFVKYNTASFSKLGYVAKTAGLNQFVITDFYRYKDVSSSPGGTVTFMKTGRTSGMTKSSSALTRTCVNVRYDGDAFTYLCLNTFKNTTSGFSQGGDSGAPIFIDLGNKEARLVGVLKGLYNGDPIYSPWSGVTKDFGTLTIR